MVETTLETRHLGLSDLVVSAIGLGCMSFSGVYGPSDDAAAVRVIHDALDAGVTMLDTADMYGWGHNETLVGRAIKGRPRSFVLASKFGQVKVEGGANGVDGRPDYVMRACDAGLQRLGVDTMDLYYQHRVDPSVPIEDTVGAMARLVEQGKVRAIGLSEAAPATIRRAHKVHPIAAVQSEYSLLYRTEAEETLRTTRELGISFVAYSPLGRGLLTNQITPPEEIKPGDTRGRHPRFAADNLARNLELVKRVAAIAAEKRCTPGQLVLAWLLAQGPDIVAIPGTKHSARMRENLGALSVRLDAADVARITAAVPADAVAGTRYPEPLMKSVHV